MFGKMMNRYYYGKSGKGDYTKEDLPETRWQLFWEMLRVRLSALFRLNMMYVLVWLPTIIVIARAVMMAYSGLVNLSDMQLQLEAGELTAEAYAEMNATFGDAMRAVQHPRQQCSPEERFLRQGRHHRQQDHHQGQHQHRKLLHIISSNRSPYILLI